MVSAFGIRPGGGRNPLPFAAGGGFTGMNTQRFVRYWVWAHRIARGRLPPIIMLKSRGRLHTHAHVPSLCHDDRRSIALKYGLSGPPSVWAPRS